MFSPHTPPWITILGEIYGQPRAAEFADDLAGLLSPYTSSASPTRGSKWDEHDAWFITYPDQFQKQGEAPLRTLERFMDEQLVSMFNGVHILPFFPSSSDDGFSVTDYLAVDPRFGTWEHIESISRRRRLMVDAVINHASARGVWFRSWLAGDPDYADFFRTSKPAHDLSGVIRAREHPLLTRFTAPDGDRWVWTTFSPDQVDLDYRNPEVLLRVLAVLLRYAEHGAAVIRLDAVGFLWKEEGTSSIHLPTTHTIIRFLGACLNATHPDVLLVTETNVPHRENIRYLGAESAPEADAVYQFPLPPLTLHAFATENATTLATWLAGVEPPRMGTTFVNFLGSHDGVGLRPLEHIVEESEVDLLVALAEAGGGHVTRRSAGNGAAAPYELNATWFDLIRGDHKGDEAVARHLASHAIMLALRGIPAVYVESLFAAGNDVEGVEATGNARAINRRKYTDYDALVRELGESGAAARSMCGFRKMLEWRRSSPAFSADSHQRILSTGPGVLGIERIHEAGAARVYVNVTGSVVRIDERSAVGFRCTTDSGTVRLGPWGQAWVIDDIDRR